MFDLPGVDRDASDIDIDVERTVLMVKAGWRPVDRKAIDA